METDTIDAEMADALALQDDPTDVRMHVYEVGYHILSTLSEDEVAGAVSKIMDALKGEGASFVGDRFPSKIALAYPIAKRVNGKNVNFDSAYFGWVAFEAPREAIARMKTALDADQSVLRYLIVVTERDAVAAALSGAADVLTVSSAPIEKPKREAEVSAVGGEVSDVALDEALQTIEKEDAVKE